LETVRIWDTVGQDNVLKGEYKVISGPMYVESMRSFDIGLIVHVVVMISRGMERASVSLLSEMDERSKFVFIVIIDCSLTLAFIRFGHAFLMETGSSVGEIMGHSKVNRVHFRLCLLIMYPSLLTQFLCDQIGLSGL